jgi:hypothetical protein
MDRKTENRIALVMALIVVAFLAQLAFRAKAQNPTIVASLSQALVGALTVWEKPDGERVFVHHCRTAPGGCEARIAAFTDMFIVIGGEWNLDPWLLAALAWKESGLNPGATGGIGEGGILQLHPRGVGASVEFVSNARTRHLCLQRHDACQHSVVHAGAAHLAAWVTRCGSLEDALGGYNSGRCGGSGSYARRVFYRRDQLRELGGVDAVRP